MMYFREDSRRPMSCSREHFDSEWKRIFNGGNGTDKTGETNIADRDNKPVNLVGIEICSGCTRHCFNLVCQDIIINEMLDLSNRIEYAGYCTVKRGYIFTVVGKKVWFSVAYFRQIRAEDAPENYRKLKSLLDEFII